MKNVMTRQSRILLLCSLLSTIWLSSQAASIDRAISNAEQSLESARAELSQTRTQIAQDSARLHQQLAESTARLKQKQQEAEEITKTLTLRERSQAGQTLRMREQQTEVELVVQGLEDFQADLESRIHIAELHPFREGSPPPSAPSADQTLTEEITPLLELLEFSMARLERLVAGDSFETSILTPEERVVAGTAVQLGPVAYFADNSALTVGTVTQHPSVYEPTLIPATGSDRAAILTLLKDGNGVVPIDASGLKINDPRTQASNWSDHLKQGGPVMIPILGLALLASLIAIGKTIQLLPLSAKQPHQLAALVQELKTGQIEKAKSHLEQMGRLQAQLVTLGIEHHGEKPLLLEELLEERIYLIKATLERALPWIAVTAASAPLLGLLGTVTGMIDTFSLISVYGSGDPRLLSSGISEALITTKFGLGMAIPAMIIHAFLNRKVKRIVVSLEQCAWRFVNALHAQTPTKP